MSVHSFCYCIVNSCFYIFDSNKIWSESEKKQITRKKISKNKRQPQKKIFIPSGSMHPKNTIPLHRTQFWNVAYISEIVFYKLNKFQLLVKHVAIWLRKKSGRLYCHPLCLTFYDAVHNTKLWPLSSAISPKKVTMPFIRPFSLHKQSRGTALQEIRTTKYKFYIKAVTKDSYNMEL